MEIIFIIVGLISGATGAVIIQKSALKNKSQKILKDAEAKAENIKKRKNTSSQRTVFEAKRGTRIQN